MRSEETITVQIFKDDAWHMLAYFEADDSSHESGGYLEYDTDYVIENLAAETPFLRAGLRYPLGFDYFKESRWPAFLLDILPSGAGRRVWARRLQISESYSSDWQLLKHGAGNPPGNLRILEAVTPPPEQYHQGFPKPEIIEKNADFVLQGIAKRCEQVSADLRCTTR